MQEIDKRTKYFILYTFIISFSLGMIFDHLVLHKPNIQDQKEIEESTEVVIKEIKEKDKKYNTQEGCTIYVDINGAVLNPGVYCLDSQSLLIDAVNKAGGFSKDSNKNFIARKINLSQPLTNYQKIYFPFERELICTLVNPSLEISNDNQKPITSLPTTEPYTDIQVVTTENENTSTNTTNNQCININTATKDQLITLNGIGESTAQKIIQARPYTTVEDLLNVSGIGEATLAKFRSEVCI